MRRHRTVVAAAFATAFAAAFPGIPVGTFLVTHPLPPGTWAVVIVPNAILLVGVWLAVFLVICTLANLGA